MLEGRPWCFEQRLLLLQEISNDIVPYEVTLNLSPFWVRLYNLPFGFRLEERVRSIANFVGEVLDVKEEILEIDPFRRVRIMIDVSKPLKPTHKICVKGG